MCTVAIERSKLMYPGVGMRARLDKRKALLSSVLIGSSLVRHCTWMQSQAGDGGSERRAPSMFSVVASTALLAFSDARRPVSKSSAEDTAIPEVHRDKGLGTPPANLILEGPWAT